MAASGSDTSFGARLRRLREAARLTQEELAERAGLSPVAVGKLERGQRRRPYPHTVRALADALALSDEERAVLVDEVPRRGESLQALPRSLPIPLTPLVGRELDLEEVAMLLRSGARLVTLTGPGGVGKTRLAQEVAQAAADEIEGGAAFVALAAVSGARLVVSAIADGLGLREVSGQTLQEILRGYLRERHMLLVLDNFEHVLDAAPAVADLLASCSGLTILVTSRAPLRLRGEQEYPVAPLTLPDLSRVPDVGDVAGAPAVELFVERARAVSPAFALTRSNATAVAAICRRLDGLPLALELAAARVRTLDPTELLARLDRVLPLLRGGARDLPDRQRTMRGAIAWSYQLLSEPEWKLLDRLSVFRGGWDLEAAEAVAAGDDIAEEEVLDLLSELVEQSLLSAEAKENGATRYQILVPVLEYAEERLEQRGEAEATRERHAAYYAKLLQRAIDAHTGGSSPEAWTRVLQEMDNLRIAWMRAASTGNTAALLAMARGLMLLYDHHGWVRDGVALFGQAADVLRRFGPPTDSVRGLILGTQGYFLMRVGRPAEGTRVLEEGLALMETGGPMPEFADLLVQIGAVEFTVARFAEARERCLQAARLAEATGNDYARLWATFHLGAIALFTGDFAGAEPLFVACQDAWRGHGFTRGVATAHAFIGETLRLAGRPAAAEATIRAGLQISTNHRDVWATSLCLRELGGLALDRGDLDAAQALLEESCARVREVGDMLVYTSSRALLVQVEVRQGRLAAARHGIAELLQAVRAGAVMSLADAAYGLALALHAEGADVEALGILTALGGTPGMYATLELAARLCADLERRLDRAQRTLAVEQARSADLLPWLEELGARPPAPTTVPMPPTDDTPIVPLGGLFVPDTRETLSPREVEVLRLLIAGVSNPAIAGTLVISRSTVKHHVASILRKLGAGTRTEAALRGRELGLTPRPPQ